MNNEKSIYDCYQEIKQREIEELKDTLQKYGGEIEFNEESAPIIMVNFDGYSPHPADVRIIRVRLKDDKLLIDGQEKESSGCADWFGEEKPIDLSDIAFGHMHYITDAIPLPEYKKRPYLLHETIALLSADIYKQVYDKFEGYAEAVAEIIRLAEEFEKKLDWQDDDERDFVDELTKFEEEYLKSIGEEKRSVWMRLGVTITGTKSEIEAIVGCDDDADDILKRLLKNESFTIEGDSYIPECEVEDYNTTYGTSHGAGDIEFNL